MGQELEAQHFKFCHWKPTNSFVGGCHYHYLSKKEKIKYTGIVNKLQKDLKGKL